MRAASFPVSIAWSGCHGGAVLAADRLQVLEAGDVIPQGRKRVSVFRVVDRVRLRDPEDAALLHINPRREPDLLDLALPQLDQVAVARAPQRVALGAEVLAPRLDLLGWAATLQFL